MSSSNYWYSTLNLESNISIITSLFRYRTMVSMKSYIPEFISGSIFGIDPHIVVGEVASPGCSTSAAHPQIHADDNLV